VVRLMGSSKNRHREERSDVAIQSTVDKTTGYRLLRFARNEGEGVFRSSLMWRRRLWLPGDPHGSLLRQAFLILIQVCVDRPHADLGIQAFEPERACWE